ncbi:hypothetical protein AB1K83_08430 [Sporosarcina sp. 179-K 3D1 HS]|uniref:hypothetical protein n=1 Tax=Sporosarcina sp. 179-K 3D1 HS TaxID=3232169 RepID=UPI00399FE426
MSQDGMNSNISLQQIIPIGDSFGVTLTEIMLAHLRVVEWEEVQVEMRKDELVITRIGSPSSPESMKQEFFEVYSEPLDSVRPTMTNVKSE